MVFKTVTSFSRDDSCSIETESFGTCSVTQETVVVKFCAQASVKLMNSALKIGLECTAVEMNNVLKLLFFLSILVYHIIDLRIGVLKVSFIRFLHELKVKGLYRKQWRASVISS